MTWVVWRGSRSNLRWPVPAPGNAGGWVAGTCGARGPVGAGGPDARLTSYDRMSGRCTHLI
eukprot:890413-Prymnesium_polylepis.1